MTKITPQKTPGFEGPRRAVCRVLMLAALAVLPLPSGAADAPPEDRSTDDARLWLSSEAWTRSQDGGKPQLRLGISVFASPNLNDPIIERTVRELRKKLPEYNLSVEQLWQEDLARAVRENRYDFVLSSAAFYFSAREDGLRDLATVVHNMTPYANQAEGGVVIVRADRSDLADIADLRGKRLALNSPKGIFNTQIIMGELAVRGLPWKTYFGSELACDSYDEVIERVRAGDADVGFLKTCLLEQRGLDKTGEFRVIEPKAGAGSACRTSTELYPNWTLSITPKAPQAIAGRVAKLLLEMEPMPASGLRWDVATDFSSIDRLFRTLHVWRYDYLSESWSLRRFVSIYSGRIAFGIALLALLLIHGWIVERLVHRRTRELVAAHAKEMAAGAEARAANERLEALQRASVTSQLSSIFAHEVRQPVAALRCFIRGLERMAERGALPPELLLETLGKMNLETDRINAIVERVRGYAKRKARVAVPLDLSEVLEKVTDDFRRASSTRQPVLMSIEKDVRIVGDAFEMQVLFHNLLKNAAEAMGDNAEESIAVSLAADEASGRCVVKICDHGPELAPQACAGLNEALCSSKTDGLGLGLAIVRDILGIHGGSLRFVPNDDGGLTAVVLLPLLEKAPPADGGPKAGA